MSKVLSNYDLENMYAEFLDEVYGECKIAGYEYSTSRALAEIDPVAFRCGFSDWISAQLEDGIFEENEDGEYLVKER